MFVDEDSNYGPGVEALYGKVRLKHAQTEEDVSYVLLEIGGSEWKNPFILSQTAKSPYAGQAALGCTGLSAERIQMCASMSTFFFLSF